MVSDDGDVSAFPRRLTVAALAYAVLHHLGLLPAGSTRWRGTSWVDWLDLLIPYAVVGLAGWALASARPGRPTWVTFAAGALAYTQGHGIHLAANSIGNAAPGEAAYLWDELVGHAIWYAGVAVLAATLASVMPGCAPSRHPLGWVAALAAGVTWATNALGGHTVPLAIAAAVAATGWGWAKRHTLAGQVTGAGLAALTTLAAAALR